MHFTGTAVFIELAISKTLYISIASHPWRHACAERTSAYVAGLFPFVFRERIRSYMKGGNSLGQRSSIVDNIDT